MRTALVLCVSALVLASCAPPAPPTANLEEARKVIEGIMDKAEKDMLAGVTDTTLTNYTDDAVSMPNNGPFLRGKAAIREYYKRTMQMGFTFTNVDFVTVDVKVGGRFAYEIGTYTMTMEMAEMEPITDQGKYLMIYEYGEDGKWRIKIETWNTDKLAESGESEG